MTNRAYILAALACGESRIVGALRSRDTDLMAAAVQTLGAHMETIAKAPEGTDNASQPTDAKVASESEAVTIVRPGPLRGGHIECGLAGTVMRFVPPLAALSGQQVTFTGDEQARARPMGAMCSALRTLGVAVEGDSLPFTLGTASATGEVPRGGEVHIDASASSQFVSGLLLSAARYRDGIAVVHTGGTVPSTPHIDMTVDMLRQAGVEVDTSQPNRWAVAPGPITAGRFVIEPDLSNATPFLAAAAVTGGTVRIPRWPAHTTQAGDAIRGILAAMGCQVHLDAQGLAVSGPTEGQLQGIELNMADIGELAPTVAAMATLASTPTTITGIGHLRGHETDRLHALAHNINGVGGRCEEHEDWLRIEPSTTLSGGLWRAYADHRMATAGAIVGLRIPGTQVDDLACTSKTLPNFEALWAGMLGAEGSRG